jgi:hypothetical protein
VMMREGNKQGAPTVGNIKLVTYYLIQSITSDALLLPPTQKN